MKNKALIALLILVLLGVFLIGAKIVIKKDNIQKTANTVSQTPDTQNNVNVPTFVPESSGNINLTIETPVNNAVVTTNTVTVTGITNPKAEVSVNEVDTVADANGKFTATINLDEGSNTIIVVANDSNGSFIEKDLTVTYQIPA